MKLKIQKIKDPNTNVPINSDCQRIEQIKSEFAECTEQVELCEVEVFDMWSDIK